MDENSSDVANNLRLESNYIEFKISENPDQKSAFSILEQIPDIQAQFLLLQGTGNENVAWQTVQEFSDGMEKASKTVKLVLYPNGNHALEDSNQSQRDHEMMQWFQNYGFPKSIVAD